MKAWSTVLGIWEARPRLLSVSTIVALLVFAWANFMGHPTLASLAAAVFFLLPALWVQNWVAHWEGYKIGYKKAMSEIIVHKSSVPNTGAH